MKKITGQLVYNFSLPELSFPTTLGAVKLRKCIRRFCFTCRFSLHSLILLYFHTLSAYLVAFSTLKIVFFSKIILEVEPTWNSLLKHSLLWTWSLNIVILHHTVAKPWGESVTPGDFSSHMNIELNYFRDEIVSNI